MESTNRVHVVTTALREFWPKRGPVWLLTPGCLPFAEDLPPTVPWEVQGVIQDPWEDQQRTIQACNEVEVICDNLLPLLAYRLNLIHGTDFSDRYWRIVLGIWLQSYVAVLYDRYQMISKARHELGSIMTIGLDKSCFVVPSTTIEYIYEVTDDRYNLQLYTRLCNKLNIPLVDVRKITTAPNPQKLLQIKYSGIESIIKKILITSQGLTQKIFSPYANIILQSSYHPRTFALLLTLATGGRIWDFVAPRYEVGTSCSVNSQMRNVLHLDLNEGAECEKIIAGFLHVDIPKVFVEDYASLCKFSASTYRRLRPNVIISMNSWWFDEAFKQWAACCSEKGVRLIGGQHGGNYGVAINHDGERFERKIVDTYFTWGWSDSKNSKTVPSPASKLLNLRKRSNQISGTGILYIGTAEARFRVRIVHNFAAYISWQHRFFKAVPPDLIDEFLVRLHYADYGWCIKRRLENAFPKLLFETWDRPFRQSLDRCRLLVCDHLSTTYAEALASNVPTVLFWNEVTNSIRDAATPVFSGLKACHILHDTPESAAAWIREVYPGIEDWWLKGQTQKAVLNFCDQYAQTSKTPLRDWVRLLIE